MRMTVKWKVQLNFSLYYWWVVIERLIWIGVCNPWCHFLLRWVLSVFVYFCTMFLCCGYLILRAPNFSVFRRWPLLCCDHLSLQFFCLLIFRLSLTGSTHGVFTLSRESWLFNLVIASSYQFPTAYQVHGVHKNGAIKFLAICPYCSVEIGSRTTVLYCELIAKWK